MDGKRWSSNAWRQYSTVGCHFRPLRAEVIGEMLAVPSPLATPPVRKNIVTAMAVCVEQFGEGNAAALARAAGLPKTTLWEWQHGLFLPPLEILVGICSKINM